MTFHSTLLTADRIASVMVGSSIPLVAVISTRPFSLPFSLYDNRWSRECVRTVLAPGAMLMANTRSAASFQLPAWAPVFRGRKIVLSVSVDVLAGLRNSATAVISCAVPGPTVVVLIFWLTICHCCTRTGLALAAAMVAMFRRDGGCKYITVRVVVNAKAGLKATGARRGCAVGLLATGFLGAFLSTAAAVTSGSEINGRGAAVV